jgi:hypothetical protein
MLAGRPVAAGSEFVHEAMLYQRPTDFIRQAIPFIRAVSATQPILVAVDQQKTAELRSSLGADATKVRFRTWPGSA